jgi:hypothetical protein
VATEIFDVILCSLKNTGIKEGTLKRMNKCSSEWTSVLVINGVSHTDMRITDVFLRADGTEGSYIVRFCKRHLYRMSRTFIFIRAGVNYRIYSHNLRTFFPSLAAEKSGCVKYADFFCGGLDLGFILV